MRLSTSRSSALTISILLQALIAPGAWCSPAAAVPAVHAVALEDTLRLDPRVRAGVLPNGLLLHPRNHKPEARVVAAARGQRRSIVEDDDQRGLAHFSEHMTSTARSTSRPEELVDYLESIGMRFGADANAYTAFDETVYMLDVPDRPRRAARSGLDALARLRGRARRSSTREVDKERGVVIEEWRLGRGAGERMCASRFPVLFHGRATRAAAHRPARDHQEGAARPPAGLLQGLVHGPIGWRWSRSATSDPGEDRGADPRATSAT